MCFYDCDCGIVPDNGQNDVTDGSVENYSLDWDVEPETETTDATELAEGCSCIQDADSAADAAGEIDETDLIEMVEIVFDCPCEADADDADPMPET